MKNYLNLVKRIIEEGEERKDRTGTGTYSLFGPQLEFNLKVGFPIMTTKKVHWKSVVEELLWMLRGETNVKPLQERGVSIWDEWADENGELGPVYGKQWRKWEVGEEKVDTGIGEFPETKYVDQLADVIKSIKDNPFSRRHIVTAWNPGEVDSMKLPPCHLMYQFYVHGPGQSYVSCKMIQRSADVFLGVPFNIASYALLTHIVAKITGKLPGTLTISFGDVHLYKNHLEQAKEQLSREAMNLPTLKCPSMLNSLGKVEKMGHEDFVLEGYNPQEAIKAEVSV